MNKHPLGALQVKRVQDARFPGYLLFGFLAGLIAAYASVRLYCWLGFSRVQSQFLWLYIEIALRHHLGTMFHICSWASPYNRLAAAFAILYPHGLNAIIIPIAS